MSAPSQYLVTGATGVVGSAFVEHVLRETNDSVFVLVRHRGDLTPERRLDALWHFWQLGRIEPEAKRRVKVLSGDTETPRLGLSAEDWDLVATQVTHIVHAAASVKMNLPLEAARRAAVSSCENVVALAEAAKAHQLRKIEVVSTVGVNGRRAEVLLERWLETPRPFHNTYEESKADAELIARQAVERGLPVTVLRPSMVVGDSRSGRSIAPQIFSYICEFLTGARLHGLFPSLERARLDVVPVDWVAKLLLASSRTQGWTGRVLHACSAEASVPLGELRDRVARVARAHGRRVLMRATLPLAVLRAAQAFGSRLGARKASALLDILLAYLEDDQRFANEQTLQLAARQGLVLPLPAQYLDTVLWETFSRER